MMYRHVMYSTVPPVCTKDAASTVCVHRLKKAFSGCVVS